MMEAKKVTGVRLDFSDGSYRQLRGDGAQKWNEWLGQVCVLAHTHGLNPPWDTLPWEEGTWEVHQV